MVKLCPCSSVDDFLLECGLTGLFPWRPWLLCAAVQREVVTTETTCLQELKDWPRYHKNVPASTLAACNNPLESDVQTFRFQFCCL